MMQPLKQDKKKNLKEKCEPRILFVLKLFFGHQGFRKTV